MHADLCRESSEDQLLGREPEPQLTTTYTRKALMHAIEESLDVQDHRFSSIDNLLSSSEAQGARQLTRVPMNPEDSGAKREEGWQRGQKRQKKEE
jgi:hypothetical protein